MKVKYIKEGYFNNPDQMKKKADLTKSVSNAERLASSAHNIVYIEETRKILEDFLKRDFGYEHYNDQDENIFCENIFGSDADHLFYIGYFGRPGLSACVTRYEPVFSIDKVMGEIYDLNIDIYVYLNFPEWIKHIERRRKYDKTHSAPEYGMLNYSYDMKSPITSMSESTMYNIKDYIKEAFIYNFKTYVKRNAELKSKKSIVREKIINSELLINLNKIHLFPEIEGDIVCRADIYERASYSSNESVNELKENMMRRISWLLQIVSFDNKGEFIIRDSLSRGPDLYVKKEINLNES